MDPKFHNHPLIRKLSNDKENGECYITEREMTRDESEMHNATGTEVNTSVLSIRRNTGFILFNKLISPLTHIDYPPELFFLNNPEKNVVNKLRTIMNVQ